MPLGYRGRTFTARELVAAFNFLRADPDNRAIKMDSFTTMHFPEFRAWFWMKLDRKINERADLDITTRTGRKYTFEYQQNLARDARYIRDYTQHRIRNSGCRNLLTTPELKRRYPHIDNQPWED